MAEAVRSDEYGARPNREQVQQAKVDRQVRAGDRPANTDSTPLDGTRNANVVRFGEVGKRAEIPNTGDIRNAYPDTASEFRAGYDKAGIQPSNITTEPKRTQKERQRQESIRAAQVQYATPAVAERPTTIPVVVKKKKKKNKLLRELARARVTGINMTVWGISSTLFLPNLVFVLIAAVALGLMWGVDWLIQNAANLNLTGFPTVLAGVAWLFELITGIDVLEVPYAVFFLSYLMTLGIGYGILLIMFAIYTVSLIKCLSGEHATTKQMAFLIALIGHTIPFMNLFPWFAVWGVAVWLYPK